MGVGIVIPVWNLWEKMTLPCLKSLVTYTNLSEIHVYLVDNASTDETCIHAEKTGQNFFGKEHFTYIKNSENMGFAIACNQGAKEAQKDGHEFILFLNNDTLVTENWLPPLVKALENPRVGMVGPLLLFPNNTVQHCGVVFTPFNKPKHIYAHFSRNHPAIKSRKYKVITGAAFLCRTREFFERGGFFEEYKNGFEDVDLSYTYFENGQIGQVITESIVYHLESQTPGRGNNNNNNAELLFKRKKDIIISDAHLYFAIDGYLPAITKDFSFYVRLTEEKRQIFNKVIMQDYSDIKCLELLNQEPFWYEGYDLLIQSYIQQKRFFDALVICEKALCYCLSKKYLDKMQHIIDNFENEEIHKIYQNVIITHYVALELTQKKYSSLLNNEFFLTEWGNRLLATQDLLISDFNE